ncbi:glycosyltransferase [Sphingobacterium sp. SG20118]|uniref:glycosyltransferase n=1 Tax=Sphingobacterium sp. SG20118 TaxID=3367156 RepID=UPI0037DFC25D
MDSKVSVIVPCFNNSKTIVETLDSVFNQKYNNIELIIVNDGSIDDSELVILEYKKGFKDLIYVKQENGGPSSARNKGATLATGEFVVFLDGDDRIHQDYISLCVNEFLNQPALNLVYSNSEFFEAATGAYVLLDYDPITIMIYNCIPIVSMIRLSSFNEIGQFDESMRIAEDWEMWIRYTRKFPKVKKINQSLFFYRKRFSKDSISDINTLDKTIDEAHLYIYQKHYSIYKEMGWNIIDLLASRREYLKFKNKYYNEWFRKIFYWVRRIDR